MLYAKSFVLLSTLYRAQHPVCSELSKMHSPHEDIYEDEAASTSPHALLYSPEVVLRMPEESIITLPKASRRRWMLRFISSWRSLWERRTSYAIVTEHNKEAKVATEMEEDLADDMSGDALLEGTPGSRRQRCYEFLHHIHRYIVFLFPSFLHGFMIKTESSKGIRRSTDWLDGVRGVASLFVFFDHYLDGLHNGFEEWGYGRGENRSFFQLPFIKLVYAGSCMVAIFFIVSGYVLSHRCILQMRANKHDKIYLTLTSMTFRRGIRLFLPSVIISFIVFLSVCLGFIKSEIPSKQWTVGRELYHYWVYLNEDLFKLWTWKISYKGFYSRQLWTIPLEFKCSMALFLVILMVSRCRARTRLALETTLVIYLFYIKRWDVGLFMVGMLLAELNIIRDEHNQRQQKSLENLDEKPLDQRLSRHRRRWTTYLAKSALWILLIWGLFLGGYPHGDAPHTPGYSAYALLWFDRDWEWKWRFWLSVAAILIVGPISFLPLAQRVFTTRVARYLGRISYGLYLVHDLLDRTLRPFLWHAFWKVLHFKGKVRAEELAYDGGWIIGTIIYMPLAFWAADLFTRAVDGPTVRFARWVEGRCFV